MRLTKEDYRYLTAEAFSNRYQMKLVNNPLYSRTEEILRIASGGTVLHIGCCDHLELIDQKIKNHTWLQGLLEENCKDVYGVDINRQAIDYVNKERLTRHPVVWADVTAADLQGIFCRASFDFILLGEILEHLDDPVTFLRSLRQNCAQNGFDGRYILTVPNAFCLQQRRYRKGIEIVNSEHKYWFTPYTAAKVMVQAGIIPEEIRFADYVRRGCGGNGIANLYYKIVGKLTGKPSSHRSYRGGQLILIGKGCDVPK